MRRNATLWLISPLLCISPAAAQVNDQAATSVMAECSAADLSQTLLDSCLERVRVLEETDPSPQLQTLEASLEERESGHSVPSRAAVASTPRVVEVAPPPRPSAVDETARDQSSARAAQPDGASPPSGAALEDEPPVSDPPDTSAGSDRADDDINDPQS